MWWFWIMGWQKKSVNHNHIIKYEALPALVMLFHLACSGVENAKHPNPIIAPSY